MLAALGVTDIGYDDLRQVGRGIRDKTPSMEQLCGQCASGKIAVAPDGTVWPCVFARWLPVGDARRASLSEIVTSATVARVRAELSEHFAHRLATACRPDSKQPPPCRPDSKQPPCRPDSKSCDPSICRPAKKDCQPTCPPGFHCGPRCNPDRCWPYYS